MTSALIYIRDKSNMQVFMSSVLKKLMFDNIIIVNDEESIVDIITKISVNVVYLSTTPFNSNNLKEIVKEASPETEVICISSIDDFTEVHSKKNSKDTKRGCYNKIDKYVKKVIKAKGKLLIKHHDFIYLLNFNDIIFIEKNNKTAIIHTKNGKYSIYKPLYEIECCLDDSFFRVHKSYIININKLSRIGTYGNGAYILYFEDYEENALMSRNKYNIFHNNFYKYRYNIEEEE